MTSEDDAEVLAAGGLVLREDRVAVVHRPRYDDWSFPKGKLDEGEDFEQAALREVEEETGVTGRLVAELDDDHYRDRKGRLKRVRWWHMDVVDQTAREPDDEVDEVLPVALGAALCLLGDFPFSDTAGFVLSAALVLWQWRQRPPAAAEAV